MRQQGRVIAWLMFCRNRDYRCLTVVLTATHPHNGTTVYWPDVARSQPKFNRPSWHYQLGSSLTIGEVANIPKGVGGIPDGSSLETKDLHCAQAVQLCRKILKDKSQSKSDRALAICWLAHLVADAHQPCHAGSLYVAGVFDEGDRGANSIPTRQGKNLHALWDGLLGPKFDAGDIRRRSKDIMASSSWEAARQDIAAHNCLDPLHWLAESAAYGKSHVYAPEVLAAVEAAARGSKTVETVDLSKEYLREAGALARVRAAFAAHRLVGILNEGLEN